jgi:ATP-dependent protease HslVU (ClpYQ) ATPase subunit
MKAESVTLTFTEEAIREIARIAYEVCSPCLPPRRSPLTVLLR